MFNEKKLHYLIVAALAASFSSDAAAATRSDDDVSEFTTPSRASSLGFAACESTDTACWNQLRQEERSCEVSDAAAQARLSEFFHDIVPAESSAGRRLDEIDLGDGRRFTLDSIRYQDDYFATTLDAVHSTRPISLRLDEVVRNSELFDTLDASQRLAYVTNANQQHLWTYVGRVVEDGQQEPEFIEGSLPLKVEVQRTPDAGMELSIAVDGEELARQLM